MEDKEYNLFYALNRLINDTEESVDTILAEYFLGNLGYQNFQNLKKNMINDSQQLPSIDDQKYRTLLTNTIVNETVNFFV